MYLFIYVMCEVCVCGFEPLIRTHNTFRSHVAKAIQVADDTNDANEI